MIDLSPVLTTSTSAVAPIAAVPGSATGVPPNRFGQTLGAILDARDAAPAPAMLLAAADERQGLADDGKGLPASASQDEDNGDRAGSESDAAAWFPAFVLPALPVSMPADPVVPGAAGTLDTAPVAATATSPGLVALAQVAVPHTPGNIAGGGQGSAPSSVTTAPPLQVPPTVRPAPRALAQAEGGTSSAASPLADSAMPMSSASLAVTASPASVIPMVVTVAGPVAAPVDMAAPKPSGDTPRPAVANEPPVGAVRADPTGQAFAVSTSPQPAGQVFAAAIANAVSWRARGMRTDAREPTDLATPPPAAASGAVSDRAIVQPTGDARNAALDLTRDSGLQHMIDRIETLRDDANAADTRVRLTPDALGSVDIAVRQDGDRVHVRFTAEQDATRALIAEAQPRLTELAAARGVRIGDTSVGTGAGSNGTPQQPQTQSSPRFARVPATAATETDSTTDQRLA